MKCCPECGSRDVYVKREQGRLLNRSKSHWFTFNENRRMQEAVCMICGWDGWYLDLVNVKQEGKD